MPTQLHPLLRLSLSLRMAYITFLLLSFLEIDVDVYLIFYTTKSKKKASRGYSWALYFFEERYKVKDQSSGERSSNEKVSYLKYCSFLLWYLNFKGLRDGILDQRKKEPQ